MNTIGDLKPYFDKVDELPLEELAEYLGKHYSVDAPGGSDILARIEIRTDVELIRAVEAFNDSAKQASQDSQSTSSRMLWLTVAIAFMTLALLAIAGVEFASLQAVSS